MEGANVFQGYRYGSPAQALSLSGRPSCFGKVAAFDEQSRECRGCPHIYACKQTIYAAEATAKQPVPAPQYLPPSPTQYTAPIAPQPYAQPQPGPTYQQTVFPNLGQQPAPVVPPTPSFMTSLSSAPRQPAQQAPAQPPMQMQPMMPPPMPQQTRPVQAQPVAVRDFHYGRLQDPLYYHARMMPVPMRPQIEGESFLERLLKNMLINSAETAALELLLGLRQSMLAPSDDESDR